MKFMYATKQKKIRLANKAPAKAFGDLLEKNLNAHGKQMKPAPTRTSVKAMAQNPVETNKSAFEGLVRRLPEFHAFASAVITVALFIYVIAANPITHFAMAKLSGSAPMQMAEQTSVESSISGQLAMNSNPGTITKPSKDKKKKDPGKNTTMS